jgi:uncharacterized membrane protein (UPF0127 family)
MKLVNLTQKVTVTNNLIIAKTFIQSTIGLLNQPQGTFMMFNTRWGIHTFGMKYPINILVLDQKMKVIKIKQNLQPNKVFFWNPVYKSIIEIPTTIKKEILKGNILDIQI